MLPAGSDDFPILRKAVEMEKKGSPYAFEPNWTPRVTSDCISQSPYSGLLTKRPERKLLAELFLTLNICEISFPANAQ